MTNQVGMVASAEAISAVIRGGICITIEVRIEKCDEEGLLAVNISSHSRAK